MTRVASFESATGASLDEALDQDVIDALRDAGAVRFSGFSVDQTSFPDDAMRFGSRTTCDPAKATSTGLAGRQNQLGRVMRGARRFSERVRIGGGRPPDAPRLAPWGGSGINPHTENAFLPLARPDLVWFYCERPAAAGGASILSDGTEVARSMGDQVMERVRATTLRYRTPLSQAQWQAVYETDDRVALQRRLEQVTGLDFAFRSDGGLDLDYFAPQVRTTLLTGTDAVTTNLLSRRPYRSVGSNERDVTADDQPVAAELVTAILDATFAVAHEVDMVAGDVLLIDNTRVMHGRSPFADPQRRVLTMCTFLDAQHVPV